MQQEPRMCHLTLQPLREHERYSASTSMRLRKNASGLGQDAQTGVAM